MNGNPITTVIGNFAINNTVNRNKSMKSKRASGVSPGTGEVSSPDKASQEDAATAKKQRHRLTFADEVHNDKTLLTEIHYIESYKKYNQEYYIEN